MNPCKKISAAVLMTLLAVGIGIHAAEPVAFLSDIEGQICFERNGKLKKIESSCEAVFPDDILVSGKNGRGKIVYDRAIFDLHPDSRYKVEDGGISKFAAVETAKAHPQAQGVRGRFEPVEKSGRTDTILPKTLVAAVVPGITRAAGDLPVYSPKNQIFSLDPRILLGGTDDTVYEVILLVNDQPAGKPIRVAARQEASFTSFGVGRMKEGEMYALEIRKNGQIVNDVGDSGFYLMEEADRTHLREQIRALAFSSEKARMFYTANLFCRNECFAEAGILARRLTLDEPGNKIYANLLGLSRKALGY